MPARPTKSDVGKRYNVFFRDSEYGKNMGVKPDVPVWTGKFTRIEKGEAIIEKDKTGVEGSFGKSYRFEEVSGGGTRSRAQPKTRKAAKKTCSPGYDVYNFRKTRKGVFYDCLPKKRKTRRNRK